MDVKAFREILSMAIKGEVEAHVYYLGVAERVNDANLKAIFNEMAMEEAKHRASLEGYLARPPASLKFDESHDYKVADTLKTPDLTEDLKPVDGITIAIRKELQAMQMYTQLANRSADPDQKRIFTDLASMERGHKARLEDIYTNMAFPEVW